ncbi:replication initiation protein [Paraburkholderia sp. J8-2]|uniref:replication initiation protein n=1 Tax=Paraburkholderia sp. J8-2 TaxID=2805440 RepID=UPI002AB7AEFC|nr:replication initiation protein [Paraburkholderia sp. J8-2]
MASSIERSVTPLQYALDLFVESAPARRGIHELEANSDIGYQKNQVFARIVGLGLSARRFVDAAYFIVAQEAEIKEAYDVTLSFFKWLMRYDSKNREHFSNVIRSVKSSMLEVTSAPVISVDQKGRLIEDVKDDVDLDDDSVPPERNGESAVTSTEDGDWLELIGRVSVRNGRIRFRVPIELQRLIKDPQNSYWTSLLVTSRFTVIYARAIYDHVLPTLSSGTTGWLPIEVVRNLPGRSWANHAEFKYFKRDYLEPAVKQINELSDIDLSYETRAGTPGSRKQDQIRLRFKRKEGALAVKAAMLNSVALFQTLQNEFGLSDKQFERIESNRATWTDDRIQQAIEYTRWTIRQGTKVKRASAYLMKSLAENYRVADADKQVEAIQQQLAVQSVAENDAKEAARNAAVASVVAADKAADQRRSEEIRNARETFAALSGKEREGFVRKFTAHNNSLGIRSIERQGLKPAEINEANVLQWPSIADTFCLFVAGELRKAKRTKAPAA